MKVYQCKRELTVTHPIYIIIKPGDKFYEKIDKYGTSYMPERGYPYPHGFIENNTVHFERLPDDDHTHEYYLDRIYTQHQVDMMLNDQSKNLNT